MCTGTLPLPARRADATGRRQGQPIGGVAFGDGAGTPPTPGSAITSGEVTSPPSVARDEQLDELPKVTLAFLRTSEDLCPRRVRIRASEPAWKSPRPVPLALANQLTEHARLRAHRARVAVRARAHPAPRSRSRGAAGLRRLCPLVHAAVRRPAVRSVDGEELDEWETTVPDLGVRLVGRAGPPRRGRRRPGRATTPRRRRTGARRRKPTGAARGRGSRCSARPGGWRVGRSGSSTPTSSTAAWSSTRSPPT